MSASVLQNIVFPSKQICETEELFYHKKGEKQCFDSYFNVFSCLKWKRYTHVQSVFLKLEGEGEFEISLLSEKGVISEHIVPDAAGIVRIELPEIGGQKFIWFEFTPRSTGAKLKRGAYLTDQEPLKDVKLAADICTFRREEYVRNNLALLKTSILENEASPLYGKMDVFLVDNGRTLKNEETETGRIFLFPNKNAGGTGGFTRGILEILKRKEKSGYTHMIFMDDDARLIPDAFVRCYALLSFIREEYKDSAVAGALLDEDIPYLQQEAGAYYRNGHHIQAKASFDLRNPETVQNNETAEPVDYAGWWLACFPLSFVRQDNLPIPFFIHFDDLEYGLRNGKEIIYLNGICVWHAAHQKRTSQTNIFYNVRNRLVTDALYVDGMTTGKALIPCLNEILYSMMRYQYSTADMVLQAVKDFTGGPKKFGEIDPEQRHNQIRKMADRYLPPEELTDDPALRRQINDYMERTLNPAWDRPLIGRKRYLMTLNGWLLPSKKQQAGQVICCDIFRPDLRELYRAREGLLIDPYAGKGTWVRKSFRGMLHCLSCMLKVTALMGFGYRKSREAFARNKKRLTHRKFWEKYLGLK